MSTVEGYMCFRLSLARARDPPGQPLYKLSEPAAKQAGEDDDGCNESISYAAVVCMRRIIIQTRNASQSVHKPADTHKPHFETGSGHWPTGVSVPPEGPACCCCFSVPSVTLILSDETQPSILFHISINIERDAENLIFLSCRDCQLSAVTAGRGVIAEADSKNVDTRILFECHFAGCEVLIIRLDALDDEIIRVLLAENSDFLRCVADVVGTIAIHINSFGFETEKRCHAEEGWKSDGRLIVVVGKDHDFTGMWARRGVGSDAEVQSVFQPGACFLDVVDQGITRFEAQHLEGFVGIQCVQGDSPNRQRFAG